MADLNALILADSGVQLVASVGLNEKGEIVAQGMFPSGETHAFLLIPCDQNHLGMEGCDYNPVDGTTASDVRPAQLTPSQTGSEIKLSPAEMMTRFRSLSASHHRRFGTPQTSSK